jgi:hypothetical protein
MPGGYGYQSGSLYQNVGTEKLRIHLRLVLTPECRVAIPVSVLAEEAKSNLSDLIDNLSDKCYR